MFRCGCGHVILQAAAPWPQNKSLLPDSAPAALPATSPWIVPVHAQSSFLGWAQVPVDLSFPHP